jgi:hypothetical protein
MRQHANGSIPGSGRFFLLLTGIVGNTNRPFFAAVPVKAGIQ